MADRYQRVYLSRDKLYKSGSPVIITASALLKDNTNGKILAQIKLQSITNNTIIACKVNIRAYEVNGTEVEGVSEFAYLDLDVKPYVEFGSKTPVLLSENTVRRIAVSVTEVVFQNGSIWQNAPCEWEQIPKQETLEGHFSDTDLRSQYVLETGGNCSYVPAMHDDLFLCTCGAISHVSLGRCYKCKREYAFLKNVMDEDYLTEKLNDRLKKEEEKRKAEEEAALVKAEKERIARAEADKAEEEARILSEQKKKKRNKRLKILGVLAVLCAVVAIIAVSEVRRTQAVCDEYLLALDEKAGAFMEDPANKEYRIFEMSYNISDLRRTGLGKEFSTNLTIDCLSMDPNAALKENLIASVKECFVEETELPSGYQVNLTKADQKEMLTIILNGETIYSPE